MAQIVGFDQDPDSPDGTGLFHFDSGQSVFAHDPDTAAQFKPDQSIIDAAQPGVDQRLAANDAPPMPADQNASYQPPTATDAGGAPARVGTTTVEPAEAGVAAPGQPEAPAPPGAQSGQPASPYVGQEAAAANYINRPVVSAPTKGGYKPKTSSETYETTQAPYTQEDVAAYRQASDDAAYAKAADFGAQAQRAQTQQAAYQAQLPVLQAKQTAAQAQVDAANNKYQQERAGLQKLIDSNDPKRIYHQAGTGGTIAIIMAQAMGAFAATRSGGQNHVQNLVNDAVNRDIAAQKDQQNSALKQLELQLGDKQQAEAALKVASDHYVANQAAAFAAQTDDQKAQAAAHEFLQDHNLQMVKDEKAFRDASIGKHTVKIENAYQQGSAGGMRAATEAEKQSRIKTLEGMGGVMKTQAEVEKLRGETGGGGKETREEATKLADSRKEIVQAQADMQPLRDILDKYKGQSSIPGYGLGADIKEKAPLGRRLLMSDEERTNRGTIERAATSLVIAMYGRGAERNNELIDKVTTAIQGSKTPAELDATLRQFDTTLAARRKDLESGASPAAMQYGEQHGAYQPTQLPSSAQRIGE